MKTPRQMSVIFQVSAVSHITAERLLFKQWWWTVTRDRNPASCECTEQIFIPDMTGPGLQGLCQKGGFTVAKVTNLPLQRLHCVGQLKGCFLNENNFKNAC